MTSSQKMFRILADGAITMGNQVETCDVALQIDAGTIFTTIFWIML
jgi:hypothetical protein